VIVYADSSVPARAYLIDEPDHADAGQQALAGVIRLTYWLCSMLILAPKGL
jgi:hypothetical protein